MADYKYNPWPNGLIPEELQRPELKLLKEAGYDFDDAREVVDIFEREVAAFFNAPYAVAVDCCTHAIQLCLEYRWQTTAEEPVHIKIPKRTYVSVPMAVAQSGHMVKLIDLDWKDYYYLNPTNIIDAAAYWQRGGYVPKTMMCLSFQIKKHINIGRGGMILLDDKKAYDWLRLARYDGRDMTVPYNGEGHIKMMGYHYYLTPEDCARGILLMRKKKDMKAAPMGSFSYPDTEEMLKGVL